ncbi:MAG: TetR/AcrR family transcriptional regulator [Gemmatimonadales bacterium]
MAESDERSAITIGRILDAARALFAARGYPEVTTDEIARAARVTKGGLYHHFPSKQRVYVAMLLADLEAKRRLFAAAVASHGTCRERLARLTGAFLALPEDESAMLRLVRRDVNFFQGEDRTRLVRAYQRALPEQVEAIVRDGMAEGELAPGNPRLVSWAFVGLVQVMIGDYAVRELGEGEARLEYVLRLFFEGAVALPAGVGR